MRLHEEYAIRKGLDIPIVLYEHKSSVFLRSKKSPYRWRVFSINWKNGHYAPGAFHVSLAEPNQKENDEFFAPVGGRDFFEVVQWEDYSDFVVNFAKQTKPDWLVVKKRDRELALWSMFLQVYDRWIAKHTTSDFHSLVAETIREDNNFRQRSAAFRRAKTSLETNEDISRLFKYQIFSMVEGHSDWLEKLINDC